MSGQLLVEKGFDVVTDDLSRPFIAAAGALKDNIVTVRHGRPKIVTIPLREQRTRPTATSMRAVDDVIRQHFQPSEAKK